MADEQKKPELKMWLAVRQNIEMSPGKLATQAGHAYGGLYAKIWRMGDDNAVAKDNMRQYLTTGTPKISVKATNLGHIARIIAECIRHGIPNYAVVDAGRTELEPHTLTCVAFGPAYRDDLPPFLKRLQLL